MKLVRSDTPEVVRSIASAGAVASSSWTAIMVVSCVEAVPVLLIALTLSLIFSVRAAARLSVPLFLALTVYVLWRGRSLRLYWYIAGCAERVYVRLFVRRGGDRGNVSEPDVLMLEAPEIVSMSVKTLEVYLYGPKPRIVEWLVIEPAQAAAEDVFGHVRPLLCDMGLPNPDSGMVVAIEEGRLTMRWQRLRPALREFIQGVVHECPSIVIAHEERSKLDLNGIWGFWSGYSTKPVGKQRQMLVRAKRLGFGGHIAWLLYRHKWLAFRSPREAAAYLKEIEREEAGTEHSAAQK